MRCFLLLTAVTIANILLAQQPHAYTYEQLREYEGEYRYFNNSTIQFAASPKDGNLYLISYEAKRPLQLTGKDIFEDGSSTQITFSRDREGKINGYSMRGQNFALVKKVISDDRMWYPRESPGKKRYAYKRSLHPKLNDGINTGLSALPASTRSSSRIWCRK
jgi:hypothetical protein